MGSLARILVTAVSVLLLTAGPAVGQASPRTFTVVSTTDAGDDNPGDQICRTPSIAANGPCTLRAAIQEANFFNTADTIIVPAGTYPLTLTGTDEDAAANRDLDITQPVTITGAGPRSTVVDAGGSGRVFEVTPTGAGVLMTGLTIRGAGDSVETPDAGGGVQNQGGLTIRDSAIVDNAADSADGSGIFNVAGTLTLDRVLVARNVTTDDAGGIGIGGGTVAITNSTISGNQASDGAGIQRSGTATVLSIAYSTITGNIAGFGRSAIQWGGPVGAGNGIRDSIVAQNTGGTGQCQSPPTSGGHNIESGADCGFTNTANGDRQLTNPQLGPLADNGGPTDTHHPAATSPALDSAAAAGCPATDQRGFPRPSGAACDIGAVELQVAPPPPPPPATPAALFLEPATADRTPGETHTATAIAQNNDGSPAAGRSVRFEIDGVNEDAGAVTTDASGRAQISWKGVHEGTDVLKAYVDGNTNQTLEPSEPTAQSSVNWVLPAPVQGRTANIEPVSGRVRITVRPRRSGSGKVTAAGATSLLTEARQVPLDTVVDVRKGRVRMTTTANRAGDVQKGEFYGGVYTTRQTGSSVRPVTELRLTESLICQPNTRRGRITASRARSRRLWGNGRGRYRTRGRHSTATVRGTIWLQKDTCTKTTTVVRQGVVDVRDLAKRKTVRVRAGKRYVARRASRRR